MAEDAVITRVRERLMDGSLTKEQAAIVLQKYKASKQPANQDQQVAQSVEVVQPDQPEPSRMNRFAPQHPVVTGGQQMAQLDQERESFLQSLTPERRAQLESIGGLESFAIGAGKGLTDIARGVGLMPQSSEDEKRYFQELERIRPVSVGGGEVAGQAAPFILPGLGVTGIASTPLRVAATAGLGATEGGIIARGQGGDIGQQLLSAGVGGTVAGALELGIPVIGRVGGKIYRRLTGKTPAGAVVDRAGNLSEEMITALRKEGLEPQDLLDEALVELKGQVVDPEQAARRAFLQSQGIEPTKAQVTRLSTDFIDQQELAKRTSKIRTALQKQNAALTTRFNNKILETGGDPNRPVNTVIDTITERATRLDSEIGSLYKKAAEIAPGQKNVRFDALTQALNDMAPQNRKGGYNIESVVGELKTRGILNAKGKLVGKVDVNTAEEVRQVVNSLYDGQNPYGNIQLRAIKEKIDDDVFRAAGEDVYKQSRQAKHKFETDLSRAKISKFDSRKANLVRDVLENQIDPDRFVDDVVFSRKWRAADLNQLKTYLEADDAGKAALNDMRAETLQNIRDRAFSGPADENGFVSITRTKLESALDKVGDEKLKVLFKPEEMKFLKDMLQVTKLREPVPGAALGEGPTGVAVNKLRQKLGDLSVFAAVFDSLRTNREGRLAVRAMPEKIISPTTGSTARQALSLGGAAVATQQTGEQ